MSPVKRFSFSLLLLPFLLGTQICYARLSAEAIVKRADRGRLPDHDVSFVVSVTDFNGDTQLRETRYQVFSQAESHDSLVTTIYPDREKGRKLLMKGDDLWFFTPDIARPTRVSMQQRLTGEVSNGDVARTDFAGDYSAKLVGITKKGSKRYYHLELTAKRDNVTYAKIAYWVTTGPDILPAQADFFATSGMLLKRANYESPKKILGKTRITKVVIRDSIQKKRRSVMIYSQQKLVHLHASMFNKDAMSN